MLNLSKRTVFLGIFLACVLSVIYALYAEFYLGDKPCPLCIAQRVIIIIIGLVALIAVLHNPKSWFNQFYGVIIAGLAIFGIKVAAHHVWLMHLPEDQQPMSCGMPLGILYQRLPLNKFVNIILQGDAECGKVSWQILGMSAPTVVIIFCSLVLLATLYLIFRNNNR